MAGASSSAKLPQAQKNLTIAMAGLRHTFVARAPLRPGSRWRPRPARTRLAAWRGSAADRRKPPREATGL